MENDGQNQRGYRVGFEKVVKWGRQNNETCGTKQYQVEGWDGVKKILEWYKEENDPMYESWYDGIQADHLSQTRTQGMDMSARNYSVLMVRVQHQSVPDV